MTITYRIVRFYANQNIDSIILETGMPLDEVQEYCRSDESSSKNCSAKKFLELGEETWFEGYDEE